MTVKYFILITMLMCGLSSNAQDVADKTIYKWTVNYYQKRNSDVKKNSDVSAFLIETIEDAKFQRSIFIIGVNVSGTPKMLLIRERRQKLKDNFIIIGDSDFRTNIDKIYFYFSKNNAFSNKTKVLCYERLIIDSRNMHGNIK